MERGGRRRRKFGGGKEFIVARKALVTSVNRKQAYLDSILSEDLVMYTPLNRLFTLAICTPLSGPRGIIYHPSCAVQWINLS